MWHQSSVSPGYSPLPTSRVAIVHRNGRRAPSDVASFITCLYMHRPLAATLSCLCGSHSLASSHIPIRRALVALFCSFFSQYSHTHTYQGFNLTPLLFSGLLSLKLRRTGSPTFLIWRSCHGSRWEYCRSLLGVFRLNIFQLIFGWNFFPHIKLLKFDFSP